MHMNTYKVVFKKGYVSNFYHESIEAESIDEASMLIKQKFGKDVRLIKIRKERIYEGL